MTSALLIAAVSVAFSIETAKSTYLVGEPIVLTVTPHGRAHIYADGWFELAASDSHLRVLVDRGRGFERFRRTTLGTFCGERSDPGPVALDRVGRREFVLSYDDAIRDVVFPAAGPGRIAIEYEDPSVGLVRSNVVTLSIEAPQGEERRAWDALRAQPERGFQFHAELTSVDDAPELSGPAEQALIAAFPRSVYLQGARVRSLRYRFAHPSERYVADDLSSPAPMDGRERKRLAGERRAALLTEAEALADELAGGQFEPDALSVLAGIHEVSGQDEQARRIWQQIVDRFPCRVAADDAREALAPDDEDDDPTPARPPRP